MTFWRKRSDRDWPLPVYLTLFGLAIAIPTIVFAAFLISWFADSERALVEQRVRENARALSASIDRDIDSMITSLMAFSSSSLIDEGDFKGLHERAKSALTRTDSHIIMLDLEMQQLFNTRVPYGTELGPTSDPESAQEAIRSKRPYVSNLFFGKTAQKYVFNVIVPVIRKDEVRYVLIMTRNADSFTELLRSYSPEPEWGAAITDRLGRIITRLPAQSEFVGRVFRINDLRLGAEEAGIPTGTQDDDVPSVYASDWSPLTGWRAYSWVPLAVVEAPVRRSWYLLVLGGLALLLLSALFAFLFGGLIARPIRALAASARAFGRGAQQDAPLSHLREANELAEALNLAARERTQREARIQFLLRELQHRTKNMLAVVQAMAYQIAHKSDSKEEFEAAFAHRLEGLAVSVELLVNQDWQRASVAEIMRMHMAPFLGSEEGRAVMQGPELWAAPEVAHNLGLALHELATNASKYGALSSPQGKVFIDWSYTPGPEPRFGVHWREEGGPPVDAPSRSGFGRLVIERMVQQSLSGDVTLRFEPDGVVWTLDMRAKEAVWPSG